MLAIWQQAIAKCTLAIWWQPIAKHSLAILVTSNRLNRNNRVSSFYWTRGSKLCFLTCFSYFSRYFHILVILQNHYLLISLRPFSAARESDFLSHFSYLYIVHAPPCFWHRTRGFLKARRSWEPGSQLTTGEFFLSAFCWRFPMQTSIGQTQIIPFSLTKILKLTLSCVT